MRERQQDDRAQLRLSLALAAVAAAAALVLPGQGGAVEPEPEPASVELSTAAGKQRATRGPRGPIGKPGPRGERGDAGSRGEAGSEGPRGKRGADAPVAVEKVDVAIDWQNFQYQGRDRQTVEVPGIGTAEIRCTPPNPNETNGVMRINFRPSDLGPSDNSPPSRWATTMWAVRHGGNVDDADAKSRTVVETTRIDRANQKDMQISFNTDTFGHDPESQGHVIGMITTEPFDTSTTPPPAVSFQLTWYWNFRNAFTQPDDERCYMAGMFLTEAG